MRSSQAVSGTRGYHRGQLPQPGGDRNRAPGRLRPLTPRIGIRPLHKEQLQPRISGGDLLDAFARQLQAVALRVVDSVPPLRDLVVIKVSDPDAPPRRRSARSSPAPAPAERGRWAARYEATEAWRAPSTHRRRQPQSRHRSSGPNGPAWHRPNVSRLASRCEILCRQRAIRAVRTVVRSRTTASGQAPAPAVCPTSRRTERASISRGSSLGLFWDFRLHQPARA